MKFPCIIFYKVDVPNRPLKNVFETADTRQKQAKNVVYDHDKLVFSLSLIPQRVCNSLLNDLEVKKAINSGENN